MIVIDYDQLQTTSNLNPIVEIIAQQQKQLKIVNQSGRTS